MTVREQPIDSLRESRLTWVAILEAEQKQRPAELAHIAISLFGQLGEAQAEICRLRAALHSSLRALAPAGLGGW
jgi:hypothetical protein